MTEAKGEGPLYKGSCHCGFFTYEARIDLQSPKKSFNGKQISKCNCTICHKTGAPLIAPEDGTFKIISPPKGREELTEYHFKEGNVHHWFCPKCGIKPFIEGKFNFGDQWFEFQRVNVLTIDERADGSGMDDLRELTIGYYAGRSNDWSLPVADEPYPGGIR
ncbi:hypothetical protein, variant 2 [Verruconis gallopava]|uniref:CENP-V/GFA domain-containing protein n=1 Tax=Verruconis gallopava TaxID=253628 RepID=A0A0D1YTB2_9PEZI|nr:uncharacterized protein PV09_05175 [Verruconis gallopava]XP_016213750.1 hypothetical protein, variant 1 [Verruconis gallopava]XP_016213751.1 hypothetical protein, variant 2 [Verruconis gallopava]KIW03880.1 hypothetical protein PV09_05175 [Verruconis gallopava]KIW03881.1 hypothetical protein, variant 1 [Verruconis gallopava]KIW03882.1 hypothetical protein, variant 2 [Verruconis gallopava]